MARVFKRRTSFPTLKGKKDPSQKDCILVPVTERPEHDGFPITDADVAPNTFYRVDIKQNVVRCFVTLDEAGHRLAWDTCGACGMHWQQCKCSRGVLHPDSIEWCLRKQRGWLKGDPIDFDAGMDEYRKKRRTSARFAADQSIASALPKRKRIVRTNEQQPVKRRKFVRTKSGSAVATKDVTMAEINKAAASVAAEAEDMLSSSPNRTRAYKRRKKS